MSFKIHPGIDIARVGNSPEFFIGPETLVHLARDKDPRRATVALRVRFVRTDK
jgi:hypothetical protein